MGHILKLDAAGWSPAPKAPWIKDARAILQGARLFLLLPLSQVTPRFRQTEREPKQGEIMELVAQIPIPDGPEQRLLTYSLSDADGARVIISVRADLADDDLAVNCLRLLSVPLNQA